MTIEEKAKAYDEALEKAKEMMDNCSFETTQVVCQELFPELRESEDERIRKEMIDFIQWSEDRGMTRHDYHQAKRPAVWIAYLEKQKEDEGYEAVPVESTLEYKLGFKAGKESERQKEQKTLVSNDLDEEINRFFDECIEVHDAKIYGVDEQVITVDCYELTARHFAQWAEKQKEQKSIQTSEEKEYIRTLKSLISDFIRDKQPKDVAFYQKIYDWLEGRHMEQKDYRKLYEDIAKSEWFKKAYEGKSLGDDDEQKEQKPWKVGANAYFTPEQKPAEWSEEDSDNLERVDNYLWMLDSYIGDDCATPQGKTDNIRGNIREVLSPWLKSLPERFNLQPKQEWSEEDD